ncbi:MAG: aminoglycoside phosphotransferase family protein [Bacteroidota bacterium]
MELKISQEVLSAFGPLRGTLSIESLGSGHIHDTYLVQTNAGPFVLQAFNDTVFQKADQVAANIAKVSSHLSEIMFREYPLDAERRFMKVIESSQGPIFRDSAGAVWRVFDYVSDTTTIDEVSHPKQAWEAARAYGEFIRLLAPLDLASFHETIPNFHYLPFRLEQFEEALAKASSDVLSQAGDLTKRLPKAAKHLWQQLPLAQLPKRLVHNDTKINNVLLDQESLEGLCVIDLDTIMPGYLLYDFGDMVRSFVSPTAEDEKDLALIEIRGDILVALEAGFLAGLGNIITPIEKESLPLGGKLMTLIMATRFLTDFLNGNIYYKTDYPTHNLDISPF